MVTLRKRKPRPAAVYPTVLNLRMSYQLRYALDDAAEELGVPVSVHARQLLAAALFPEGVPDDV